VYVQVRYGMSARKYLVALTCDVFIQKRLSDPMNVKPEYPQQDGIQRAAHNP